MLNQEKCLGNLILTAEEGYQTFTCDKCGNKYEEWKKFYTEYLQLYKTKENWDKPANRVSCVLGLFCHLYREKYQTDYLFVPHGPNPFSEKECRDANLMISAFGGDVVEVRKYLIWAFKTVIGASITITSLAYLNTPNIIRKYKLFAVKRNSLTRHTQLPEEFLDWCRSSIPDLFKSYTLETMNDLGALLNYVNNCELEDQSMEKIAINKSIEMNLIKNNKLNIEG